MVSGKAVSLFPETFKSFKFWSNPIEIGSDSRRFEARLRCSSFPNPAIHSGITCFLIIGMREEREENHKVKKTDGRTTLCNQNSERDEENSISFPER